VIYFAKVESGFTNKVNGFRKYNAEHIDEKSEIVVYSSKF